MESRQSGLLVDSFNIKAPMACLRFQDLALLHPADWSMVLHNHVISALISCDIFLSKRVECVALNCSHFLAEYELRVSQNSFTCNGLSFCLN